jgi:hypothetical protein
VRRLLTVVLLALAVLPAGAQAREPWPPPGGPGQLYVHMGEEHWNDDDGLTLLPKVVADSIKFRPDVVTMSGDKANDGRVSELTRWRQIMEPYDRAGIPYFPGVGNHDGKQQTPEDVTDSAGGVLPLRDITTYKEVFAGRPYPFGDAPPYRDPRFLQRSRPASDPPGASSHYFVDHANTRFIFIDNSCYGIVNCDPLQSPSFPDAEGNRTQYEFLARHTREAKAAGRLVFVVMHMPTRDPRDQEHSKEARENHVMGKGSSPDNLEFERRAAELGVDAVLLGHIKGQWLYRGRGDIPYYIDGGAGGELYSDGPVGTDHGYWHGFRLLRVTGQRVGTDTVPIFVRGGIRITGPGRLQRGEVGRFEAFGRQPVFVNEKKVDNLELRDPAPIPRPGITFGGALAWVKKPELLLLLPVGGLLVAVLLARLPRRRLRLAAAGAGAVVLAGGLSAVSAAQQSTPTATKRENLPNPARIWTSANESVLVPVPSSSEDPRRNPRKQTHDGAFRARCPGNTRVVVQSGVESRDKSLRVPSRAGRIQRSTRVLPTRIRPGRKRRVARVRLAQPAEVEVRVTRGRRLLRTLRRGCFDSGRSLSFFWDGRLRRNGGKGRLVAAAPRRYRVQVRVHSDRPVFTRSRVVRVLPRR